MHPHEKQPRAIDVRPQWIEADTMHQCVDPDPVAEARDAGVLPGELNHLMPEKLEKIASGVKGSGRVS
jgi:hypothetical protein